MHMAHQKKDKTFTANLDPFVKKKEEHRGFKRIMWAHHNEQRMLNTTTSLIPRQIFTASDHEPLNEEGSIGDTVDCERSMCFLLGPSLEELAVEAIGDLNTRQPS